MLAALAAAAAVVGWLLASGLPVAWVLLGATGVLSLLVLAYGVRERRFLEPLPLVAAVVAIAFVIRPLDLFLNYEDLLSYQIPTGPHVDILLSLENQEVSRFATEKLRGPLEPALTRAVGACALFMALVIVGYYSPVGRMLARRFSRAGRSDSRMNVRAAVAACLVIGLVGQLAILVRVGGVSESANTILEQRTLTAGGAILYIVAGFAVAGLLIWAAWHKPTTRLEWAAFTAVLVEICAFHFIAGSRLRLFTVLFVLAVTIHFLWRRWRLRELAVGVALFLVLASAYLGVREATFDRSFAESLKFAPKYVADPRGLLNDITEFDILFVATNAIGDTLPHKHGGWFVDAWHSYVPGSIDANKPESADIVFRKAIWGKFYRGGRPPTVIGDFYYDFGWAGIAVGSLLFGVLARGILGLLEPSGESRRYRAVLYAIAMLVLLVLLTNTYSIALGFMLTLGVPFVVGVYLFGRLPERPLGRLGRPAGAKRAAGTR
jgi:oligosaccharide repeat unit polymerase